MIKIDHLTKQIPGGPTVLSDISFVAHKGEFVSIVGASGSGKSMLLKCLALREKWTTGKYTVEGVDVLANFFTGQSKIRREFAFLEEKPILSPSRTALKNVLVGTKYQTPAWRMLTGMVRNDDYMGAMDTLEKLGLLDKAKQKAEQLSGGERQRVAIARALVHGAKVLLADEPISGLDPHTSEQILRDLKALCQQGLTVVAVIHQSELAEKFSDRIIGLNQGRLVLDVRGRRLTTAEKLQL
ncbi:phosphonate ABC transporter ATP-binding protein [Paenibacillus sp. GCM10012307]|uniref:ATP-binding cassette domain-containing protein n=1 Tax=Paenibacillus roseus TaxID=2798579 RepID=A0A934J5K3_9BACL|nr:ATP-binding cassette domain-containing protein [Paenibacillus roseus]MBJ6363689.1 ATP-binding cassette domain-containing protein [Paenibacillus roseus]